MVDNARSNGIKVIGEFVENEEIFIILKKLGVDYMQGYFFEKPAPLDRLQFEGKNVLGLQVKTMRLLRTILGK